MVVEVALQPVGRSIPFTRTFDGVTPCMVQLHEIGVVVVVLYGRSHGREEGNSISSNSNMIKIGSVELIDFLPTEVYKRTPSEMDCMEEILAMQYRTWTHY